MELKKNPKCDLAKKEGMFRNLGLTISLFAVILVFELPPRTDTKIIDLGEVETEAMEVMEIPPTEQPPPPPPQAPQIAEIREIPDEEEIEEEIDVELDVEVTEVTTVEEIVFQEEEIIEEKADEIFLIVEEEPEFPGGISEFYKFVQEHLKYPSSARRMSVQGRVFVEFTIEKDGSLTDIKVVKGIGAGCDEEAARVMNLVPNFKPGKQRGMPVRVKRVFPIHFKLAEL